ncbi:MAG: chorismate synthase [Anaerolineae bacterium]|jgi:chorismate synthase
MLRFLTAGESHGPGLTTIIEGLPAGLPLTADDIDRDLARRQQGYGRGGRQRIEHDRVQITGGVIDGRTIGAPVALHIVNRDWENWRDRQVPPWTRPRPGHADLAGATKYGLDDMRLIAERASARETAARVAAGAVARALLRAVDVEIGSYVEAIGGKAADVRSMSLAERIEAAALSDVSCPDPTAAAHMRAAIDAAREAGDSLGGVIVVVALNAPIGLGSHVQWDRRLDGRLAQAMMSIQAIKGVEIGPAFENATFPGTRVHDALYPDDGAIVRHSNRAGGIEGGTTNGEPIVVRAAMKPIPTTVTPVSTVDLATGEAVTTEYQRSDVCAVPAAAVVGEAMVALILADALLERYGGDTLPMLVERVRHDR